MSSKRKRNQARLNNRMRRKQKQTLGLSGPSSPAIATKPNIKKTAKKSQSGKGILIAAVIVVGVGLGLYGMFGGKGNKPVSTPEQVSMQTNAPMPPPAPTSTGGPKIQFASTVHDFGKIEEDQVVKHSFVFTNTGNAMLEVSDVKPGCGCTTAGEWTRQVEPGQTGTIPIEFNSRNFTGEIGKSVTVTCNDPKQSTLLLQIKGNVWRPIVIKPANAVLNLSAESPSNATSVRIISNLEEPLILSDLHNTAAGLGAELQTNQPGKEYELVVKTLPPWPTNSVQGKITMKTSATQMNLITINAWANVQEAVTTMPTRLMLPPAPLTNAITLVVWIRNNGTNNLVLSKGTVNAEGVEVTLHENQPGQSFRAEIKFPAGFEISADKPVEFTVESNHPQYPLLKVPIIHRPPPVRL